MSESLRAALAQRGSSADVVLEPHDEVRVFSFAEDRGDAITAMTDELKQQASSAQPLSVVSVDGYVRFPGRYPLDDDMRVSDLLRAEGSKAGRRNTIKPRRSR